MFVKIKARRVNKVPEFKIHSKFKATGDQPQAIESLVKSLV